MIDKIILKLHSIGAIKFGSFEIKKDFLSPFQIDFSGVISHPALAKDICGALSEKAKNLSFDLFCGTPLVGAAFATYIAWESEFPLIALRSNGIAKVEGTYKSGQRCLLLQDILLTGTLALHSVEDLENEGVEVRDILSFIDMELGGKKQIKDKGLINHSLIGVKEVIQILFDAGKLRGDSFKLATDFLEDV